MELSFRTIRLFHVDDNEDKENVGDEDDGNRTESPVSIQLQEEDTNEERYGVDRCLEP